MVFIQESSVSSPSLVATVLAFIPNKAVLVQAQQSVLIPNQGSAGCSISSTSLARLSTTVLPSQAKQCKLMQNSAGFHGGGGILLRRMIDIGYLGVQQPF